MKTICNTKPVIHPRPLQAFFLLLALSGFPLPALHAAFTPGGIIPASSASIDAATGGDNDGSIIIPSVPGIIYKINGCVVSAGTHEFVQAGSLMVTAEAAAGHVIIPGSVTSWSVAFGMADPLVNFWTPGFIEAGNGVDYARVILPPIPGITYKINSNIALDAGTYYFFHDEFVYITATDIDGYFSPGNWTHTFGGDDYNPVVTPAHPSFVDPNGGSGDASVVIPFVPGVIYRIDGEVALAGPCILPSENGAKSEIGAVVTAEAAPGYEFASGVITGWSYYWPGDERRITPGAPVFHDAAGGAGAYVTIPSSGGSVIYRINGSVVSGGADHPLPNGGTVVVTAEAAPGYYIHSDAAAEWTHVFAAPQVTPPTPPAGMPAGSFSPGALTQYEELTASAHLNAVFSQDGSPVPGLISYNIVVNDVLGRALAPGMTFSASGTHTIRASFSASGTCNAAFVDGTLVVNPAGPNPNNNNNIPASIKTALGLNPSAPNNAPAGSLEVNIHTPAN